MNEFKFSDLYVGQKESFNYEITKEKMEMFLKITKDINPLHNDEEYAKEKGYPSVVVYGLLTTSALSTLAGVYLPGKYSLIHSIEMSYVKPVFLENCPLEVNGEILELDERFSKFTLKVTIYDNKKNKVCRGKMQIGVSA